MEDSILPNLIVMDGGEIQVHAAEEVLATLNIDIPVMGIQKDDHHKATILFFKDKLIPMDKNDPVFLLLADISERVHDFAISFFRSQKAKGFFKSRLDEIEGLGPKRKEALIKYFTTIDNVKNASIYYYTGASYLALGNTKKALELYKEAVEFDNSDYDIVYNCSNLLYQEGQYQEAAKILLSNSYAKMNHKTFALLGDICIAEDKTNEAIEYYSKACRLNPRNPLYYYSLATAYSVNGFLKEAEENYHNAVKLSPNNLFYAYTLALVYYQMKQISKAKEKLLKLVLKFFSIEKKLIFLVD